MRNAVSIIFAVWAFLAASASVHAQEWIAAQVSQPAHYTLDAQTWHEIRPGMEVPNRSWIQTGKRGRLLLRRDAEMIQFKPATVAAITSRIEGGALLTNVKQKTGALLLDVETRTTKHTAVETPFLAAVVKGTRFEVAVSRRGASLRVERGIVETTHLSRGERVNVMAGQRVEVSQNSSRGLTVKGTGVKAPVVRVAPVAPNVEPAMTAREAKQRREAKARGEKREKSTKDAQDKGKDARTDNDAGHENGSRPSADRNRGKSGGEGAKKDFSKGEKNKRDNKGGGKTAEKDHRQELRSGRWQRRKGRRQK